MRGLAAVALLASAAGCGIDTQPCVERGTSSQLLGSASYDGQITNADGSETQLHGASAATVTVDDFTTANSCSGNPVEFTVRVGDACVLWATATDDSGNASIETVQTCSLPTPQGTVTIAVDQGTIATSSPSSMTLSGGLTGFGDASPPVHGYLQWSFSGP